MNKIYVILLIGMAFSCSGEAEKSLTAQEIVDKSIEASGGQLFEDRTVSFDFRDRHYISEMKGKKKTLTRILKNDTIYMKDVRTIEGLQRFVNDTLVTLSDSLANVYSNSVNSVHYFAKLPYGLNDPAVQKEKIGEITIDQKAYYRVKVTFEQASGGDDFDDTYIYWINKKTFTPDYLGYSFHVNGGGTRFRVAYNERIVNGIRFVDYENLKPKDSNASIFDADSLFINGGLELLSKIELKNVIVSPDSYN
ncbi:DUF6503 family protein [Maribacter sp. 2307UL18-2]|uniref:DUF6503 family protein n=1 Tax=Maribacter sp. 2307UL18-2 TaxID=3386274 RepID=UPI0039BCE264